MVLNGYVLRLDLAEILKSLSPTKILANNVNQIARRLNEQDSFCEKAVDDAVQRMDEG